MKLDLSDGYAFIGFPGGGCKFFLSWAELGNFPNLDRREELVSDVTRGRADDEYEWDIFSSARVTR